MKQIIDIPTILFSTSEYDEVSNEIVIDLNNHRYLDDFLKEYEITHRRIFGELILVSPSGTSSHFNYPRMDGWEIVYEGKKCDVRLTYAGGE